MEKIQYFINFRKMENFENILYTKVSSNFYVLTLKKKMFSDNFLFFFRNCNFQSTDSSLKKINSTFEFGSKGSRYHVAISLMSKSYFWCLSLRSSLESKISNDWSTSDIDLSSYLQDYRLFIKDYSPTVVTVEFWLFPT